jgi:hypothetical protein
MIRALLIGAIALHAACVPRTTYNDDGYTVVSVPLGPRVPGGSRVHPAVIEYVFATSTSPLRAYHDAALRAPGADISVLAADARALATGVPPTGEHYARVRARRIAPAINRALAANGMKGRAQLSCCARVDRRTGTLIDDKQGMIIVADAQAQVIQLLPYGSDPNYTWDLQYVPNAFDPERPLDYETVARNAIAMHREEDLR